MARDLQYSSHAVIRYSKRGSDVEYTSRTSMLLQESLRQYLAQHPDAADGIEGIRRWWLTEELRATPIERLRQELALLVASGEMRSSILPDGTELYARSTLTVSVRDQQKINKDG